MQNVHAPYQLPPTWEAADYPEMWDNTYANMLHMLDVAVVNVTTALVDTGLWNNTLVWFSADNGGIGRGNNYPLRGHKHDPWEGGTRATAFVSGGFLPSRLSGTQSGPKLVHISDLYATFCSLAGEVFQSVWSGEMVCACLASPKTQFKVLIHVMMFLSAGDFDQWTVSTSGRCSQQKTTALSHEL
eukprot:m.137653 g.137653  ORF g.137653 m.137653 type:complete len:186 (-) comp13983_c0_seq5:1153-1710(-)